MKLIIKRPGGNILEMARRAGYIPQKGTVEGDQAFVRLIGGDFPRFHLYVSRREDGIVFDLHLDQKKTTYEGSRAHSGEYSGGLVKDELYRIHGILSV